MAKFIDISTKSGDLLLINVSHIVYVKKEEYGATMILSINDNELKEIATEKNYQEIKDLLEN